MTARLTYKQPDSIIGFTALIALLISYVLLWKQQAAVPVNFIDGDSEYYYYYLQSSFVDSHLINYEWLKPGSGSFISHHPVGVSLLLLPGFLIAFVAAGIFDFPIDGLSLPFQLGIAATAIFYCMVGLVYLKKLFRLNAVPDPIAALVIALVFFGTTLYHYTLVEGGMSHVYSFCFITVFLYHSCKFVLLQNNRNLMYAALAFGIVLLLRPNNGLILLSVFFWFKTKAQCVAFFKNLVRNKTFYISLLILAVFVAFQLITWAVKEHTLFTNRYAPYGFYWLHPQVLKMLFGFNGGFFIYTPLCFLFLFGLAAVYRENKFMFYALSLFVLGLFYFFSAYSAYTYFDGLGIRVLVDYYAVFALLGAKLFTQLAAAKMAYSLALIVALFFVIVNIIYSYQDSRGILLRSGMTFKQWKYVFLRTGDSYRHCLGGSHDLTPYAKEHPEKNSGATNGFESPFDFSKKDFGVNASIDSLGFDSDRILLKISCSRTEQFANASHDALICVVLQDGKTQQNKSHFEFKLNETPAMACCDEAEYRYTSVMNADFKTGDKLTVFLWNVKKQPFFINTFSIEVYNYNYQIN